MPQIPGYQQQVTGFASTDVRKFTAEQFGGGAAMARAGEELQQASDRFGAIVRQKNEEQAALRIQKTMLDAEAQWSDHLTNSLANAEPGAPDFTKNMLDQYDAWQSQTLGGVTDEKERTVTSLKLQNLRNNISEKALAFEVQERMRYKSDTIKDIVNTSSNLVYSNPSEFSKRLADAETTIAAAGLSPRVQDELLKQTRQRMSLSAGQGMIETDPSGAIKMLNSGAFDTYLDADKKASLINAGQTELKRRAAEARAAQQAALIQKKLLIGEANGALKNADDRLAAGFTIPDGELKQLQTLVAQANDPAMTAKYDQTVIFSGLSKQLRQMSPSELQDTINTQIAPALNADGASDFEFKALELAQKTLKTIKEETSADPMSYATKIGMTQAAVLDLENIGKPWASDKTAEIAKQSANASAIAEHFAVPVKPLTAEQADGFSARLTQLPVDQQLIALRNLSSGLGDQARNGFAQIASRDKVSGYIGGMVASDPTSHSVALSALKGNKMIRDSGTNYASLTVSARQQFDNNFASALPNDPELRNSIFQTALAKYVYDKRDDGEQLIAKSSDFEKAITDVLGANISEMNGKKFVLPRGVSESEFNSFFRSAAKAKNSDEVLRSISANKSDAYLSNGMKVTAETIRKNGQLESIGDGRYRVMIGGEYALGKDAKPFVIEWK